MTAYKTNHQTKNYIKHLICKASTMEIKDINANQGNIDVVGEIVTKDEPRTFEKFGRQGRVCNAIMKDDSGEIKLTLWNDDVDKVSIGSKVHIQNGWCSEYKGEKQLSTGKFGKLEVVSGSTESAPVAEENTESVAEEELVE